MQKRQCRESTWCACSFYWAATRNTKVLGVKEKQIAIPREFYKIHKTVTITADTMFINGILFLVIFLRKCRFRTAEFAPKRTAKSLAKHLKKY